MSEKIADNWKNQFVILSNWKNLKYEFREIETSSLLFSRNTSLISISDGTIYEIVHKENKE